VASTNNKTMKSFTTEDFIIFSERGHIMDIDDWAINVSFFEEWQGYED